MHRSLARCLVIPGHCESCSSLGGIWHSFCKLYLDPSWLVLFSLFYRCPVSVELDCLLFLFMFCSRVFYSPDSLFFSHSCHSASWFIFVLASVFIFLPQDFIVHVKFGYINYFSYFDCLSCWCGFWLCCLRFLVTFSLLCASNHSHLFIYLLDCAGFSGVLGLFLWCLWESSPAVVCFQLDWFLHQVCFLSFFGCHLSVCFFPSLNRL